MIPSVACDTAQQDSGVSVLSTLFLSFFAAFLLVDSVVSGVAIFQVVSSQRSK